MSALAGMFGRGTIPTMTVVSKWELQLHDVGNGAPRTRDTPLVANPRSVTVGENRCYCVPARETLSNGRSALLELHSKLTEDTFCMPLVGEPL